MTINHNFLRMRLTKEFLDAVYNEKQQLLNELMIYGTDPVRVNRRMRMLRQLSEYEALIVDKIQHFESNNPEDYDITRLLEGIYFVSNRAA